VLQLSPEQTKKLGEIEAEASRKLEAVLTDKQRKQLKAIRQGAGPFGPGGPGDVGRILPSSVQEKLKLTAEQKKRIAGLQKDAEGKVNTLLKDEQKKRLKGLQDLMKAFAGGPPGFGPGGPGGAGGFGPPGGFGGTGGGAVFRAYRYGKDYKGLAGKDLTPGKTIEELEPQQPEKKRDADKK
jgi:hypothetical protein